MYTSKVVHAIYKCVVADAESLYMYEVMEVLIAPDAARPCRDLQATSRRNIITLDKVAFPVLESRLSSPLSTRKPAFSSVVVPDPHCTYPQLPESA